MNLPTSPAAERAVLGAVLSDGDAFARVADKLQDGDFYEVACGTVWSAMASLFRHRKPIDLLTVCAELESSGSIGSVGGVSFVASLAEGLPDSANIEHYADIMVGTSVKRQLVSLSMDLSSAASSDSGTAGDAMSLAQERLLSISNRTDGSSVRGCEDILEEVTGRLQKIATHGIVGVETGFPDIDQMILAMEAEDLVILAARPSVGKTALAGNIAANVCKAGKSVFFSTLEMSSQSIVRRLLAREGRVWYKKLRRPFAGDKDFWTNVAVAQDRMAGWKLFIDDTPGIDCSSLLARAQRVKMQHGLDLLIVDYLQLMSASGVNSNERVGTITKGLKGIAKTLKVPVLALSQLSRDAAKTHREPNLTDLRDSGSIEQDADVVIFLHSEAISQTGDTLLVKVIVGKQRNGETGDRKLLFNGSTLTFSNYAKEIA